jgi:hypothetical protein
MKIGQSNLYGSQEIRKFCGKIPKHKRNEESLYCLLSLCIFFYSRLTWIFFLVIHHNVQYQQTGTLIKGAGGSVWMDGSTDRQTGDEWRPIPVHTAVDQYAAYVADSKHSR